MPASPAAAGRPTLDHAEDAGRRDPLDRFPLLGETFKRRLHSGNAGPGCFLFLFGFGLGSRDGAVIARRRSSYRIAWLAP